MLRIWILRITVAIGIAVVVVGAPQKESKNHIAGASACATCHKDTYDRWSDSIHGKMIQPATRKSVVSRSDVPGGPTGRRFWRDGAFFINEGGVENRVDLTLGNRRIQHYLTSKPDGQIIVLHSTWDVNRQQWFDSSEIVPNAPPHFIQQWNQTCFYCHVTQQQQDVKGFDPRTLTYRTTWVESSASCERCHGPMSEHALGNAPAGSFRKRLNEASRYDKLMVCGQCHWAKIVLASGFNTGNRYFDYYSPGLIHMDEAETTPSWWADGRPRRFSLEAAAFFLSSCFQSGKAFCTSCHDPHWNRTDGNEELMKRPDGYCMKCHAGYEKESHTRHASNSSGSSCVACHMPYTVSGIKSKMRDHSMLAPEPENTAKYDIPNACNECHTSQTAQWAAAQVDRWYPKRSPRLRSRANAFALAKEKDPAAIEPLVRLVEHLAENPLIRASAVGYLANVPNGGVKTLMRLSTDKDPMVRLEAARAMGRVNQADVAVALSRMLSDEYRAVRIAAVASLIDLTFVADSVKLNKQHPGFVAALQEYRASLQLEGDNPVMQVRLGSLDFFLEDLTGAREAYQVALKLDAGQADAYVGLALVEAKFGNFEAALNHAEKAANLSGTEKYWKFVERMKSAKR